MNITFTLDGMGHCLYSEAIDLSTLGVLHIKRATRIEFDNRLQVWRVKDTGGFALYTSRSRQTCLEWEQQYYGDRMTKANHSTDRIIL